MIKMDVNLSAEAVDRLIGGLSDGELNTLTSVDVPFNSSWESLSLEQKKAQRAGNLMALRRRNPQLGQELRQQSQREAKAQQDAFNDRLQQYKAAARQKFQGSDYQFSLLWKDLERKWLLDQVHGDDPVEANARLMRRSGDYSF